MLNVKNSERLERKGLLLRSSLKAKL
jgi:hypothetical protein